MPQASPQPTTNYHSRPKPAPDMPIDIVSSRMCQALAVVDTLMGHYSDSFSNGDVDQHPISARAVLDTLWAAWELLQQGRSAVNDLVDELAKPQNAGRIYVPQDGEIRR